MSWGETSQIKELKDDNDRLFKALLYLWQLRKRGDPIFVYVDYTTRRKVRDILGSLLSQRIDGA